MKKFLPYTLIALGIVAIGCGSKADEQSDASTTPVASPTDKGGSPTPSATTTGYAAVQQIFTASCKCHSGPKPKAGLDLTSYEGAIKGGTEGAVITAGDPDGSVLVKSIKGEAGAKKMPPMGAALTEDQIKTISDWIKAGPKNG